MIAYKDITKIIDLFNTNYILFTLAISVVSAILLLALSKKYLQILQQSSYRNCEFNFWLKKKPNVYNSRLIALTVLSFLGSVIVVISFAFLKSEITAYASLLVYILFVALYFLGDKKHKDKCPLSFTNRIKRLIGAYFLISLIISFALLTLINIAFYYAKDIWWLKSLRLSFVTVLPCFIPKIIKLANLIISPIEKSINKKFIKIATKKLESFPDMIKIGITGSYGKTSVKNMLSTILSSKYKVFATPKSYNTPMGVSMAVESLDSSFDIFICEMGARYKGDIKELCDIVNPSYGIITGITKQHLQTFKTLENIKETKAELLKAVKTCVISSDSDETLSLETENGAVITAGINEEGQVFAQDIKCTKQGSEFILNFNGQKISASTKLLGEHNVSNLVLASALAFELGLSLEEIAEGISKVENVPHRLELVKNDKGITIIDDSYNANPVGTKAAIRVAKSFGSRTIVVTPGMVELGKFEKLENIEYGKNLAVCDIIILVGETCAYSVREGLFEAGFNFDNVFMVKTMEDAKVKLSDIVQEGDTVLFENDLPDRFL